MLINDTMTHTPLSSQWHIGGMTDGIPSMNACSCLNQLQVWKLLQCRDQVVCPKGLNGGLKALLFDFKELPLWNTGTADESTWDPPLIEVDLSSVEPEATNITPVPPLFLAIGLPCNITTAINLCLQGAVEWLQLTSPTTSAPITQHSTPRRKLPSVASTRATDPLGLEGADLAIPHLMATSSQASSHVATPENIPSIIQISHSPSPPAVQKTLEVASIPPFHSLRLPQGQSSWPIRWDALTARGDDHGLGAAAHN